MHPSFQERFLRQQQQQQSPYPLGMYHPSPPPYHPGMGSLVGLVPGATSAATCPPPLTSFVRQVSPEAAAFAAAFSSAGQSVHQPSWSDRYNRSLSIANQVILNSRTAAAVAAVTHNTNNNNTTTSNHSMPSMSNNSTMNNTTRSDLHHHHNNNNNNNSNDMSNLVPPPALLRHNSTHNLCTDSLTDEDEEEEEQQELMRLHKLRSYRASVHAGTSSSSSSRSVTVPNSHPPKFDKHHPNNVVPLVPRASCPLKRSHSHVSPGFGPSVVPITSSVPVLPAPITRNFHGAARWNADIRKDMDRAVIEKTTMTGPERVAKRARLQRTMESYQDNNNRHGMMMGRSRHPSPSQPPTPSTTWTGQDDFCQDTVAQPSLVRAISDQEEHQEDRPEEHYHQADTEVTMEDCVPTFFTRTVTDESIGSYNSGITFDDNSMDAHFDQDGKAPQAQAQVQAVAQEIMIPTVSSSTSTSTISSPPEIMEEEIVLCKPVHDNENDENAATQHPPVMLATPEDKHWLSDLVCLIRENIEVFAASKQDVAARSRRGGIKKPIAVGRVGLRCARCKHLPADRKAKGAVSYPNSVRIVHQAVRNWQRYHFQACREIPAHVKEAYRALKSTRSHSGNASLKYWIDSAERLGLMDTTVDDGIRFRSEEGAERCVNVTVNKDHNVVVDMEHVNNHHNNNHINTSVDMIHDKITVPHKSNSRMAEVVSPVVAAASATTTTTTTITPTDSSFVLESDRALVTDFIFELVSQQQACHYKQVDRNGKRKFREIGFPGVECRHCARNAGAGRYFPLMVTTLANNNNPFNCTHSHMMKCRRCPQEIKEKLAKLQLVHAEQGSKLPSGWKKNYFDVLWERLHGAERNNTTASAAATATVSPVVRHDLLVPTTTTTTMMIASPPAREEEDAAPPHSSTSVVQDDDTESAALALSTFSAQAFRDAAKELVDQRVAASAAQTCASV